MERLENERFFTAGLLILTVFILINVDTMIGIAYSMFALLYYISVVNPKVPEVELLTPKQSVLKAAAVGLIILVGWLQLLLLMSATLFAESVVSFEGVFSTLRGMTTIPVLVADPNIIFVIWGLAIPWLETMFFLSFVLVFWAGLLKVPVMWQPGRYISMLWVAALVGASASLFHMATRQLSDVGLFVDFLFFSVSAGLIFMSTKFEVLGSRTRHATAAVAGFFHMFLNSGMLLYGG